MNFFYEPLVRKTDFFSNLSNLSEIVRKDSPWRLDSSAHHLLEKESIYSVGLFQIFLFFKCHGVNALNPIHTRKGGQFAPPYLFLYCLSQKFSPATYDKLYVNSYIIIMKTLAI